MPQIRLEGIGKDYPQEHEKQVVHAIRSVDLTIEQGEFVFVTGSSGAGKSTLLQLIACETPPTHGHIFLDEVNVTRMSQRQRAYRRLCFGYVPQFSTLARKRTIEENLLSVAQLGRGRVQQPPQSGCRRRWAWWGLEIPPAAILWNSLWAKAAAWNWPGPSSTIRKSWSWMS